MTVLVLVARRGGGGHPIDEDPVALMLGGALPPGIAALGVRAEAEGWGDDAFVLLATAAAAGSDAYSLTAASRPGIRLRDPRAAATDPAEVRVVEAGRALEPVPERPVGGDVGEPGEPDDPIGEAMTLTTRASGIVPPCCARRRPSARPTGRRSGW